MIKEYNHVKYMKLSYAITVCNESRDLFSLVSFLLKVKDEEDEINILLDTLHASKAVRDVLTHFSKDIVLNEREFNGNFAEHRNFHLSKCNGDYIFIIDPDEMPKENLIINLKKMINDSDAELIMVPRINIHPGYTEEWLKNYKFSINEVGWINWPDYISRVFKNTPEIKYGNELHEVIVGADKKVILKADPNIAVWHIKSIEKQDNRWNLETGDFKSPTGDNLYDTLM